MASASAAFRLNKASKARRDARSVVAQLRSDAWKGALEAVDVEVVIDPLAKSSANMGHFVSSSMESGAEC